ncbi:MAG: hypothetical protein LBF93_06620 [Zoogloeaceae bacterium]|jgi:hypothetical protein|nr:hypothetical protein [Zoogloeaceae bacterium]
MSLLKAIQAFAWVVIVVVGAVIYGLFWLYENIDTPMVVLFLLVVIPPGLLALWFERRRAAVKNRAHAPVAGAEARKAASAAQTVDILDVQEEAPPQRKRDRVHRLEIPIDGEDRAHVVIDWRAQMEEIAQAWREGDYDFARTWLQKLAYALGTIESGRAPLWAHDRFKSLVAAFTQDDPLYKNILCRVIPAVTISPGVLQSQLMKALPDVSPEHFRYVLYYAEYIGDIRREKKGRSYVLYLPERPPAESPKHTGLSAPLAKRRAYWDSRLEQMTAAPSPAPDGASSPNSLSPGLSPRGGEERGECRGEG